MAVATISMTVGVVSASAQSFTDLYINVAGPSTITESVETIAYTVTIGNDGPSLAPSSNVSASFPGIITSVTAESGVTCKALGQNMSCTMKILNAGQRKMISVVVRAQDFIQKVCTGTTNTPQIATGRITSNMWTVFDMNPQNNTSSTSLTVQCNPRQVTGNLFITQSTTPVRSRQMLGGLLSDDILRLSLRAEGEDIDVTRLVFTDGGVDASSFSQNVSRLELYKVGDTTPFAVATVAACAADPVPAHSMCASLQNKELVIPKDASVQLLVRALVYSDVNGAQSGDHVKLTLDAVLGAKARGVRSMNVLTPSNGDASASGEYFIGVNAPAASQVIVGKDHVVTMSKVMSIISTDPNPSGSSIPVGPSRVISKLKFSADSHMNTLAGSNDVVIDALIYTVKTDNVLISPTSYKIYNTLDPSSTASCTVDAASTAATQYIVCANLSASGTVATAIDAGSNVTLVLQADVINARMSPLLPSLLQASLENFSQSTSSSLSVAGSHFRWIDHDSVTSTAFLWIEYPETVVFGTSYQS